MGAKGGLEAVLKLRNVDGHGGSSKIHLLTLRTSEWLRFAPLRPDFAPTLG